jgi:tRNA dimethylallyltransferase
MDKDTPSMEMLTILGPTACGKTSFAVALADRLNGEIISADSRQVYRGMDLGTGKDLVDYSVNGRLIPYHLIDIVDAGEKYNVYRYQHDFLIAYNDIVSRGRMPVLCGGTGLYLESVLRGYRLCPVPQNPELRKSLEDKSLENLVKVLLEYKKSTGNKMHNTTDVDTAQRAIRAIEIEEYYKNHPLLDADFPDIDSLVVGLDISRELRRERISQRLRQRLDDGMLDEIRHLIDSGVAPDDLIYYGLEYKYLTLHVIGQLSYDEMFRQLEIAIHQFAKRQMTWFRGMERRGVEIHWIDATLSMEEKVDKVLHMMQMGSL